MIVQTQKITMRQMKAYGNEYNDYEEFIKGRGKPFVEKFTSQQNQTVFTLGRNYYANDPKQKLRVYINGILAKRGEDFIESSINTITFLYPLDADEIVRVRMEYLGGTVTILSHNHVECEKPQESIDGFNKIFVMQYVPRLNTECVFLNGVLMQPGSNFDYTISGKIVTFKNAPSTGSKIIFSYIF
jgi:hypothetical protein